MGQETPQPQPQEDRQDFSPRHKGKSGERRDARSTEEGATLQSAWTQLASLEGSSPRLSGIRGATCGCPWQLLPSIPDQGQAHRVLGVTWPRRSWTGAACSGDSGKNPRCPEAEVLLRGGRSTCRSRSEGGEGTEVGTTWLSCAQSAGCDEAGQTRGDALALILRESAVKGFIQGGTSTDLHSEDH